MTEGARTVPTLQAAFEELLPAASVPVVVSAAASSATVRALGAFDVRFCPMVRGRAVWEAVPAEVAVVESPNAWGLRERRPERQIGVLVTRVGADAGAWATGPAAAASGGRWLVSPAEARLPAALSGEAEGEAEATSRARSLLKKLRQIGGVQAAFGMAESPVFVITSPREPGAAAAALNRTVRGIDVDAPAIPGAPGALRISLTAAVAEPSLTAFADAAREVLVSRVRWEARR